MEFFTHIFETYKDDLFAMALAYIGVLSIIAMFLPKDNIFNKIIKEISEVFKKWVTKLQHVHYQ